MKIYIYTIPKAGTYFLAELVEQMGFVNTGYHISSHSYLDTKAFGAEVNRRTPSRTKKEAEFLPVLRQMKDREIAFGHFPAAMMPWVFPQFHFICAYRHPKKTLVAEFLDFRFRRDDVKWVSKEQIPDDKEAFVAYLKRHGHAQVSIFLMMLTVLHCVTTPQSVHFAPKKYSFVNFDTLRRAPAETLERLAGDLGTTTETAETAFKRALSADTKTKATTLDIDREALWSDAAQNWYWQLGFEEIIERAEDLGWVF